VRGLVLAWSLTAALAPAGAVAEVTFRFAGEVTQIDDFGGINPGILVGDPIEGTYTFDPNAAPSSSTASSATYTQTTPPSGLEVTIGAFTFRSDPNAPDLTFGIFDDFFGIDLYEVESTANLATAGVTPTLIRVALQDDEEVALSGTALPATPPPLVEFTGGSDVRQFRLQTSELNLVIEGEIDELSLPVAVPAAPSRWLPAAALLIALAAALLLRPRYSSAG
jgi:hypothetical protein